MVNVTTAASAATAELNVPRKRVLPPVRTDAKKRPLPAEKTDLFRESFAVGAWDVASGVAVEDIETKGWIDFINSEKLQKKMMT